MQSPDEAGIYNAKKVREAATKEEQCKVPIDDHLGGKWRTEKRKKQYYERCLNSKSNNILFCPQEIINTKKVQFKKYVQWKNDHLKDYIKTLGGKNKTSENKEKQEKDEENEKKQEQEEQEEQKEQKEQKNEKEEKDQVVFSFLAT